MIKRNMIVFSLLSTALLSGCKMNGVNLSVGTEKDINDQIEYREDTFKRKYEITSGTYVAQPKNIGDKVVHYKLKGVGRIGEEVTDIKIVGKIPTPNKWCFIEEVYDSKGIVLNMDAGAKEIGDYTKGVGISLYESYSITLDKSYLTGDNVDVKFYGKRCSTEVTFDKAIIKVFMKRLEELSRGE